MPDRFSILTLNASWCLHRRRHRLRQFPRSRQCPTRRKRPRFLRCPSRRPCPRCHPCRRCPTCRRARWSRPFRRCPCRRHRRCTPLSSAAERGPSSKVKVCGVTYMLLHLLATTGCHGMTTGLPTVCWNVRPSTTPSYDRERYLVTEKFFARARVTDRGNQLRADNLVSW